MSRPAAAKPRPAARRDVRAVIMAGGSGTRFWPLSRASRPKQFLGIVSRASMVEETVDRIRPLVPGRFVYPVANAAQTRTLRRLLPRLPRANFLVEPLARNTAPSLILATAAAWLRNPAAVVLALPADHLIAKPEAFLRALRAGVETAAREDVIVTFGIRPTHPATGYGYIQYAPDAGRRRGGEEFFPALAFREKPSREKAEAFLAEGGYAWNSGMFIWRADVFARKLQAYAPDFYPFWEASRKALASGNRRALKAAFEAVAPDSIDYALMEKARGVVVCPVDIGWSDVGSWSSLADIWPPDAAGNAARGDIVAVDSRGCIVHNPGGTTALIGVEDLVVVATRDALLVCRKDRDQDVRAVVAELRKRGRNRLL
jgi:mannose-1-phosphate guanylyltransferase